MCGQCDSWQAVGGQEDVRCFFHCIGVVCCGTTHPVRHVLMCVPIAMTESPFCFLLDSTLHNVFCGWRCEAGRSHLFVSLVWAPNFSFHVPWHVYCIHPSLAARPRLSFLTPTFAPVRPLTINILQCNICTKLYPPAHSRRHVADAGAVHAQYFSI